jgi:hypothetical protein
MSGANPQVDEDAAEQLLINLRFLRLLDGPLDANELDDPCGEIAHRENKSRNTKCAGSHRRGLPPIFPPY